MLELQRDLESKAPLKLKQWWAKEPEGKLVAEAKVAVVPADSELSKAARKLQAVTRGHLSRHHGASVRALNVPPTTTPKVSPHPSPALIAIFLGVALAFVLVDPFRWLMTSVLWHVCWYVIVVCLVIGLLLYVWLRMPSWLGWLGTELITRLVFYDGVPLGFETVCTPPTRPAPCACDSACLAADRNRSYARLAGARAALAHVQSAHAARRCARRQVLFGQRPSHRLPRQRHGPCRQCAGARVCGALLPRAPAQGPAHRHGQPDRRGCEDAPHLRRRVQHDAGLVGYLQPVRHRHDHQRGRDPLSPAQGRADAKRRPYEDPRRAQADRLAQPQASYRSLAAQDQGLHGRGRQGAGERRLHSVSLQGGGAPAHAAPGGCHRRARVQRQRGPRAAAEAHRPVVHDAQVALAVS